MQGTLQTQTLVKAAVVAEEEARPDQVSHIWQRGDI